MREKGKKKTKQNREGPMALPEKD